LKLCDQFGDPQAWTSATLDAAFAQRMLVKSAYDWLLSDQDPPGWQAIQKYLERLEIQYTTMLDADYPPLLKNIYAPPLLLYYRGNLAQALQQFNLGVVGTRKPTAYGKSLTEAIVEPLARAGVTIISGLAVGIDAAAHLAALKASGRTIAVLAHGLEQLYPPQNRELLNRLIQTGAVLSEYEPGSKMERWNFPARNRIISGLAQGVLIVEGALTSGALLTAKFALEQNRELYALPGQANIINAEGPNHLIKHGAKLVTRAEDILQDFGLEQEPAEQQELFTLLSENEQLVYDLFKAEQRELGFDELILRTGFSIGQLSIVLLNLELKGILYKSGGSSFILR